MSGDDFPEEAMLAPVKQPLAEIAVYQRISAICKRSWCAFSAGGLEMD